MSLPLMYLKAQFECSEKLRQIENVADVEVSQFPAKWKIDNSLPERKINIEKIDNSHPEEPGGKVT